MIGGVTWHSTLAYYRIINETVAAKLGGSHSARMVLASVDFAELRATQLAAGWPAVLEMTSGLATGLAAAGAAGLVLGANTLHIIADELEERSGLPVIHIADAVGVAARRQGADRLGLLGTAFTMREPFYRERLDERFGIETLVPAEAEVERLNDLIFDEMACGSFTDAARTYVRGLVADLAGRGAGAVVLGCTELPILLGDEPAVVPQLDTLALHAEAAALWSLAE
jgi:aspartate racemase